MADLVDVSSTLFSGIVIGDPGYARYYDWGGLEGESAPSFSCSASTYSGGTPVDSSASYAEDVVVTQIKVRGTGGYYALIIGEDSICPTSRTYGSESYYMGPGGAVYEYIFDIEPYNPSTAENQIRLVHAFQADPGYSTFYITAIEADVAAAVTEFWTAKDGTIEVST